MQSTFALPPFMDPSWFHQSAHTESSDAMIPRTFLPQEDYDAVSEGQHVGPFDPLQPGWY